MSLNGTISTTKLYVEWRLNGFFSEPLEEFEGWYSPVFCSDNTSWYLGLWSDGDNDSNTEGYLGLDLCRKRPGKNDVSECCVTCTLGIKSNDGSVYKAREGTFSFTPDDVMLGWREFVKTSDLQKDRSTIECEGFLTVFCKIRYPQKCTVNALQRTSSDNGEDDAVTTDEPPDDTNDDNGVDDLTRNFTEFYVNGNYCDIILRAGDKDFPAQRLILSIRSAVFALQLQDKKQKCIEIADCNPDVLREFLMYLYTSKLSNDIPTQLVILLHYLAVRYDVPQLGYDCIKHIGRNFSVDCFCDVLLLASKCGDSELLHGAEVYFQENSLEIVSSSQWESFLIKNSSVANRLIINFMKNSN